MNSRRRKLLIKNIRAGEGHPGLKTGVVRRRKLSGSIYKEPIVVVVAKGRYDLLLGAAHIAMARERGEAGITCEIRTDPSEQEREELMLMERYLCDTLSAVEMGRAMEEYRVKHGISQQRFSRRVGLSPGTIHHYESLRHNLCPEVMADYERGAIKFKEARCLADISDFDRQRELAAPFASGQLSSVHIERLVRMAKAQTKTSPADLIAALEAELENELAVQPPISPAETDGTASAPLENRLMELAADVGELALRDVDETRRLRLISTLRILDSRLQVALKSLNRRVPEGVDVLRPLSVPVAD